MNKLPGLEGLWLQVPALFPHILYSAFDTPRDYSNAPKRKQAHEGLDFSPLSKNQAGPLLVGAAYWGRVDYLNKTAGGYGLHAILSHAYRAQSGLVAFTTLYAHCERLLVKPGQIVELGEPIAEAGATGNVIPAGARHLHFNLSIPGRGLRGYVWPDVVDPLPYLVAG